MLAGPVRFAQKPTAPLVAPAEMTRLAGDGVINTDPELALNAAAQDDVIVDWLVLMRTDQVVLALLLRFEA